MSRPNILIFMTDQQRGSTVTDPRCLTPNLDRLRARGVTFTNAFGPSPHCCPARATFMTGLYPSEHGIWHNVCVANAITRDLKEGVRLWSEDLAQSGYDLCYSGKWHVCASYGPSDYGWRERHVTSRGGMVKEFISLADVAQTVLELAGIPAERRFAGTSIVPFLRDEPVAWRDAHFTQSNGNEQYGIQRSIMTRDWKYVYNGFDYDELYDLKNDPHETRNLIHVPEHQDKVKELCIRLWTFAKDRNDGCINSYIMVGFAPYGPQYAFAPEA